MFLITNKTISLHSWQEKLSNPNAGARVTFDGLVRNHNEGQLVNSLEYESYPQLAESEGEKIIAEAEKAFNILDIVVIHRVGHLQIGEQAIWIMVTAKHRKEAFQACEYLIEEIKKRVPVWKKEHYISGDTQWINAHTL